MHQTLAQPHSVGRLGGVPVRLHAHCMRRPRCPSAHAQQGGAPVKRGSRPGVKHIRCPKGSSKGGPAGATPDLGKECHQLLGAHGREVCRGVGGCPLGDEHQPRGPPAFGLDDARPRHRRRRLACSRLGSLSHRRDAAQQPMAGMVRRGRVEGTAREAHLQSSRRGSVSRGAGGCEQPRSSGNDCMVGYRTRGERWAAGTARTGGTGLVQDNAPC